MKLIDPFAGYRLACGHPYFHISLFSCSWLIQFFSDGANDDSSDEIINAFEMLRWGHFLLFALAMIQYLVSRDSPIGTLPEKEQVEPLADGENSSDRKALKELAEREAQAQMAYERDMLKIQHRDGDWKLFSRICATISVFAYQGTVFYAQLVLGHSLIDCSGTGCILIPLTGHRTTWLVIETACFYTYMISTMAYIVSRTMYSVIAEPPLEKSDMYKALTDFIAYADINLTWFALNFVICIMPAVAIYGLGDFAPIVADAQGSYTPVMLTMWATHIISFAVQLRIYDVDKKALIESEAQEAAGSNDDGYKKIATDKLADIKANDEGFLKPKEDAAPQSVPMIAKQAKELNDYT